MKRGIIICFFIFFVSVGILNADRFNAGPIKSLDYVIGMSGEKYIKITITYSGVKLFYHEWYAGDSEFTITDSCYIPWDVDDPIKMALIWSSLQKALYDSDKNLYIYVGYDLPDILRKGIHGLL